jgi:hypothetical protein
VIGNFIDGVTPQVFLGIIFIGALVLTTVGNILGRRISPPQNDKEVSGLNTALAAVFGIVALVLSFSFSFALNRYEQRWQLVVQEANDIGTMYLRTSLLEKPADEQLRGLLRVYNQDRINYYKNDSNPGEQARAQASTLGLQSRMWKIVSDAQRTSKHPIAAGLLMTVTNDTIDISSEQRAALSFRFGGSALVLMFFVGAMGALAMGMIFGCSRYHNWLVTVGFSVLLALLLYTIIDLDNPQSGFVRVNLTPFMEQQQSMLQNP